MPTGLGELLRYTQLQLSLQLPRLPVAHPPPHLPETRSAQYPRARLQGTGKYPVVPSAIDRRPARDSRGADQSADRM